MSNRGLIHTLKHLRGNARGCVYTEPLWGIPFNLYAPYVSLYMLALGLSDAQIGLVASIGTGAQVLWALLGGAITDKLGRKRTTLIFDIISWSIPTLIWAVAQNFTYFLVAALVNAVWRVTMNSWTCLLVEDTEPDQLVDIYSWIYIAGLLAAFVTPLAGVLIGRFGLVPTMRGLYVLAFIMMTTKFLVMNALVTETRQGRVRMQETAHQSVLAVLRESTGVLRQILHTPTTLYAGALMLTLTICWSIRGTFWSVLVAERLQVSDAQLSLYPFVRSMTMMAFFFLVMPRLRRTSYLRMLVGLALFLASQVLLVLVPPGHTGWLIPITMLEACSTPLTSTMLDKLVAVSIDVAERARINALLTVMVVLGSTPFGWIAGQLSTVDRRLPFVLVIALLALSWVVALLGMRAARRATSTVSVA